MYIKCKKDNGERMLNSRKSASVQLQSKKNLPFQTNKSNEFGGEDKKDIKKNGWKKKSQDKYHGSMLV